MIGISNSNAIAVDLEAVGTESFDGVDEVFAVTGLDDDFEDGTLGGEV